MKYIIDYGTTFKKVKSEDIDELKKIADENTAYNQEDICIKNEEDEIIARRKWYSTKDGIEEEVNPIDYGDFGFYGDWV